MLLPTRTPIKALEGLPQIQEPAESQYGGRVRDSRLKQQDEITG